MPRIGGKTLRAAISSYVPKRSHLCVSRAWPRSAGQCPQRPPAPSAENACHSSCTNAWLDKTCHSTCTGRRRSGETRFPGVTAAHTWPPTSDFLESKRLKPGHNSVRTCRGRGTRTGERERERERERQREKIHYSQTFQESLGGLIVMIEYFPAVRLRP